MKKAVPTSPKAETKTKALRPRKRVERCPQPQDKEDLEVIRLLAAQNTAAQEAAQISSREHS